MTRRTAQQCPRSRRLVTRLYVVAIGVLVGNDSMHAADASRMNSIQNFARNGRDQCFTVAALRGGASGDEWRSDPRRRDSDVDRGNDEPSRRRSRAGYRDDDGESERRERREDDRPLRRPPPSQYGGVRNEDDARRRPISSGRERRGSEGENGHHERFERGDEKRRRDQGDRWERDDLPSPGRERRQRPEGQIENSRDDDAPNETSRSWFGRKKKGAAKPTKQEPNQPPFANLDEGRGSTKNPPPPPPPPTGYINPAETERTPIHYNFPTTDAAAEERRKYYEKAGDNYNLSANERTIDGGTDGSMSPTSFGGPDLPPLDNDALKDRGEYNGDGRQQRRKTVDDVDFRERRYASPRKDAVTSYMSTRTGALKVRFGSIIVGAALGGFMGKSLMNNPIPLLLTMSIFLSMAGFLRNDYGELSRALGLAFLLTFERTGSVRKKFPTAPHLKAVIKQGPRKPFPPVNEGDSLWKYRPVYADDPDFRMTYALFAMALVGSFCGGNIPLIPAWLGGILGAVAFVSFSMTPNAQGDLGRSMGMRVVGLGKEVLAINSELQILVKTGTVGGLIFDKVMIMDRKHRIKDRIVTTCRWGYEKLSSSAGQVQADMQDEKK